LKYVDIDGDGLISPEDLQIFIKRFSIIEYAKSEMTHSVKSFQTSIKRKVLYPHKPLTKFQAGQIITKFRNSLKRKKISFA